MLTDQIRLQGPGIQSIRPPVLIFVIPGNPGLIEYYRSFLTSLRQNLASCTSRNTRTFEIQGQSLAGFEINEQQAAGPKPDLILDATPPYDLQQQVTFLQAAIQTSAVEMKNRARQKAAVAPSSANIEGQSERTTRDPIPVILMGHSIGAYFLLELIARQQVEVRRQVGTEKGSQSADFEIIGGICLFPTVVDIAKSPSGRKAAPVTKIPYLALILQSVARALCALLPPKWLYLLVKAVTGMPPEAAKVTTAFVQSEYGVRQAISMGKHEIEQVTHDKWDNAGIWGGETNNPSQSTSHGPRPQLYFFWGDDDHWVDRRTRDTLITKRARQSSDSVSDDGRESTKPYMEVDTTGLPHAFCIRHSETVAAKVTTYISEITALYDKGRL